MNDQTNKSNPLVPLGIGIGVGVCSLWLLLEIWPLVVLGGAGYLVYKGMESKNPKKETTE